MSKRRSRLELTHSGSLGHDVKSALRAPAAFAEWEYLDLSSRGVPGRRSERDLLALTPEASNLAPTLDAPRTFDKIGRSSSSRSRRQRGSRRDVAGKAVVDEVTDRSGSSAQSGVLPLSPYRAVSSAPLAVSTSNGTGRHRRVSLLKEEPTSSDNADLASSSHMGGFESEAKVDDEKAFLLRYLGPVVGAQQPLALPTFESSSAPQASAMPPTQPSSGSFTAAPAAKPGSIAARALERSRLGDHGRKTLIAQQRLDVSVKRADVPQLPPPPLQSQPLRQHLPFWLQSDASDEMSVDEASRLSSASRSISNAQHNSPHMTSPNVVHQTFAKRQQHEQQQQFIGRVHRGAERMHAAVVLQRCWRGYLARVFVWRRDGPGAAWMATKIQTVMRGFLARAFVVSCCNRLGCIIIFSSARVIAPRHPLHSLKPQHFSFRLLFVVNRTCVAWRWLTCPNFDQSIPSSLLFFSLLLLLLSSSSSLQQGRRLQYRLSHAASLLQGLGRGWQGRIEAKRWRVAQMAQAASTVQRVYRGRLGKAWFELFKVGGNFPNRKKKTNEKLIVVTRIWRCSHHHNCIVVSIRTVIFFSYVCHCLSELPPSRLFHSVLVFRILLHSNHSQMAFNDLFFFITRKCCAKRKQNCCSAATAAAGRALRA